MELTLRKVAGEYWISRLPASAEIPAESSGELWSVTRTGDEVSVISTEAHGKSEGPWVAFRIVGQLDFGLTGVLHRFTGPLASAEISVFALSTFDTDYLLVRTETQEQARSAWQSAGFIVN